MIHVMMCFSSVLSVQRAECRHDNCLGICKYVAIHPNSYGVFLFVFYYILSRSSGDQSLARVCLTTNVQSIADNAFSVTEESSSSASSLTSIYIPS